MGEDNMLVVVCKSYAVAGSLERYDEESGRIDRERHLHAIANEFGKSIKARFSFICVEHIRYLVDDLREKMADIDNHVGEEAGAKEVKRHFKETEFRRRHLEQENQDLLKSLKEFQESHIQEFLSASSLKKLRNKLRSLEQIHKECSRKSRAREVEWDLKMEELTRRLEPVQIRA
ncbi:hypothetical protein Syun_019373 [Stephania yunnanensis]|uniref:Uncharacterized protein n=1 Tax=Stephania yunnanensis TaxID=152371 RepID=A0AAP0IWE6_9MAGN